MEKVAFHILHRMVLNAYVLYTQNTSDEPIKTRIKFYQDVIDEMSAAHRAGRPRARLPQLEALPGMVSLYDDLSNFVSMKGNIFLN